jgi:hypothetical protein
LAVVDDHSVDDDDAIFHGALAATIIVDRTGRESAADRSRRRSN